jgi:regulatory protein
MGRAAWSVSDDKPARRPPGKVTEAYLQRAALAYLERFASSAANLKRVLQRRVARRCRLRGEDPEAFAPLVEAVVEKSRRSGLVDDAAYAEARVATLRRRGGSARAIRAKLAQKGIDRTTIAEALPEEPDAEENAAHALARRRRLGPYRAEDRAPAREKDLAALARAGFSFEIARRVIDGEPQD